MRSGQRETGVVVIESRPRPRGRAVAGLTGLRKSCLHVVRVRGSLKIFQMAGRAGRVCQVVVAVDVALRALGVDVRAR